MVAGAEASPTRHHGEVSMESFIKSQMVVILQPFVDHVQLLDARQVQLQGHLQQSDANVASVRTSLGETNTAVLDLRGALKKTDAGLAALHEGLGRCGERTDELHQSLENTNGWVQRVHNQAEAAAGQVPELQRGLGEAECQLQALRANLQRTNDSIAHDIKGALERLAAEVLELRASAGATGADMERLRAELARRSQLLQETRAVADKTAAAAANLQRGCEAQATRTEELRGGLEGLRGQWARLQPGVEALRKDATFLKQRQEHHDAVVHTLQQGHAITHAGQETLQAAHEQLQREVHVVEQGMAATRESLDDTRGGLARANAFAGGLRTALEKASGELHRTNQRLDGLEGKHTALCEGAEKTSGALAELARDHRRSAADVQSLQHELSKSNEALSTTRGALDTTNERLAGLGGELGRASDAIHRLDQGVDLCHAGFTGLQKGFVETGTHMTSRPLTLPKLQERQVKTPDLGKVGSGGGRSAFASSGELATSPWLRDDESTTFAASQNTLGSSRLSGVADQHPPMYSSRRVLLLGETP